MPLTLSSRTESGASFRLNVGIGVCGGLRRFGGSWELYRTVEWVRVWIFGVEAGLGRGEVGFEGVMWRKG